ncbi:helix-turn-helix transcriptional regulator [Streptomyces sp. NPDC050856]|uniref:helix-turn-helix domain-containing protein n=1 Tax=Streptomyces sp. NPDC050856 TaxID=3154939 RepID=UPI00340F9A9A
MTPKGQGSLPCPNPGCPNTVDQTAGSGRPRQYCSEACGRAYRRSRSTQCETAENDDHAVRTAEEYAQRLQAIVRLVRDGESLEALQQLTEAQRDHDDVCAAVVQQARDRKTKASDIAVALHISPDKLSRDFSTEGVGRRRQRRQSVRGPAMAPPEPVRKGPRPRDVRPGTNPCGQPSAVADTAHGPPGDSPSAALTRALSHLQRTSDKTLRALGKEAGVSASYISRVLSGERTPSWKVTRTITLACGGDPTELRPLWDAARGHRSPEPATLHAALRGLHVSAARPAYTLIQARARSRLSVEDIRDVLEGLRVPEWEVVGHLVDALRGRPETIRPLWDAAHTARTSTTRPAAGTGGPRLPASAFG